MGAGWCPPGMIGIGIGGTPEQAMVMAKLSLMEPIDIHEIRERGPRHTEALRLELSGQSTRLGSEHKDWVD